MPTQQQQSALDFIRARLVRDGRAPTLEEIGGHLGVRSRGYVHRIVQALIDEGLLIRPGSGWRNLRLADVDEPSSLPILGRIAAGRPIEAIETPEVLDLAEICRGPDRFVLRVCGDSLIDIGILDGDLAIMERRDTADDGAIVAALIDGEAATLKRLQRRADGRVALIAENPDIPPLVLAAERVAIQSVLVGLLRHYR